MCFSFINITEKTKMPVQYQPRFFAMHVFKSICAIILLNVIASLLLAEESSEQEMTRGEMAGIIRSADHPCANVLNLQSTGKNAWKVQCNSGNFFVTRNKDGEFNIKASTLIQHN